MVPLATVSAVAGALLEPRQSQSGFWPRLVANPGSDHTRLGLVQPVAANSSVKGSKKRLGGSRTHGGGFAI